MSSDYRPVKRSASGEGKHIWQLLHVATGEMAGGSQQPTTFGNKGEATRAGEAMTARRAHSQAAVEPAKGKPKRKRKAAAKGKPAATGKGKGTRAKRTSARSKGGGMSPPRG